MTSRSMGVVGGAARSVGVSSRRLGAGTGLGAGLPRRGDHAELLEQAQVIGVDPLFFDLATSESGSEGSRVCRLPPSRGDAQKLSLVRGVKCSAHDYLIPFSNHILFRRMEVGEGSQEHPNHLFAGLQVCMGCRKIRI